MVHVFSEVFTVSKFCCRLFLRLFVLPPAVCPASPIYDGFILALGCLPVFRLRPATSFLPVFYRPLHSLFIFQINDVVQFATCIVVVDSLYLSRLPRVSFNPLILVEVQFVLVRCFPNGHSPVSVMKYMQRSIFCFASQIIWFYKISLQTVSTSAFQEGRV